MKLSTMLVFFLFISLGFCKTFDIPLNIQYRIEKNGEYDRIYLKNGKLLCNNPGGPEIQYMVYTYSLFPIENVEKIEILEEKWEEIPGEFYLFPEQKHYSLEKPHQFTEINPEIYNSEMPYPETPLVNYKTGNMRGYKLCQFAIAPFRYLPKLKKLMILKKLSLNVKTTTNTEGIKPKRQSSFTQTLFRRAISSLTINYCEPPDYYLSENQEDLKPTDLPSLLGPPVDLVIITKENLIQAYGELMHFEKLFGYNTVIKTLSWIKQYYSGIDDAERIRNFIKDAVEKWGTSFVLLAGDIPDIPSRWVWLSQIDPDQWPENIITDLYFSCLDGTWNFDGDAKFGEVEDSVDLYPDVYVSRLTLKNPDEVSAYIAKMRHYSAGHNGVYTKMMFVTSNLFYPNDAYELALFLADYLPQWFTPIFLNESSLQNFKDSIYAGCGIIQAIGHGDVNLWRINSTPQNVTNFFFDSLTNYDKCPLMITISCYTNPFQSDCLGEHFVNNPDGGGIAYIGPSGTSEAYLHTDMVSHLYNSLFSYPLAGALGTSKIAFVPNSSEDCWYRYYQYSINLLGVPTINIWDSIPKTYDSIVINPDTLNIGLDSITILLYPPVDSFFIIYYKEDDVFTKDSGFSGSIISAIKTESPGYLKFTILAKRYVPYIDSIYVMPSAPYLVFDHFIIRDSLNNNDGILNPGEDIYLYIGIKNNGGLPANSITAWLSSADTFINLIIDSASYPVIQPDSISKNLTPFHFKVNDSIPDQYSISFAITINYNRTTTIDSFQITAASSNLELFTQHCELYGDNLLLFPYIENRGHSYADSVNCIISSLSDSIIIIDSLAYFPIIYPDSIEKIVDTLSLILNYPPDIRYNFKVYNHGIEIINKNIKIQFLPSPDSLISIGYLNAIGLKWKPVTGAVGYRIYRSTNSQGPYKFIRNVLAPMSYYEDFNVLQDTDYYYYLVAVDTSMNEGLSSDTVKARTTPLITQGWPKTVYGYPYTSPNFGDLDPYYPGLEILIATRDDGALYAWHCDGTPLVQLPHNDGRIFVAGGPFWASPAIGDINNDGKMDIVFGVRRTTNNLYAITSYDSLWLPMPNWPITVPNTIFSAPVLGDLDNDGDLEIVTRTEQADIYVFNYDGTGYYPPNGLLFDGPGSAYGAPSLADINRDGNLEIISCGGSNSESLYVWNRYGNYLSPFPVFIQSEKGLSCAVVAGNIIGDDRLEIAFFADSTRRIYLVSPDGNVLWSYNLPGRLEMIESYPVFANIIGDEKPEIICAENRSGILGVFDSLGNLLPDFPLISSEHDWRRLISVDLNNDFISDLLVPANNWKVYGLNGYSQSLSGFPIEFGNYINSSPAVFDIDLDGMLELMVAPCDFKFYVFDLHTTKYEWPRFRYDPYNSGCYKSENLVGIDKRPLNKLVYPNMRLETYPNPFNKYLTIKFEIPNKLLQDIQSNFSLKIYDVTGRLVKQFNYSQYAEPEHLNNHLFTQVIWNGIDEKGCKVSAGVYFIKLEIGEFNKVKKVVLLK